MTDWLSQQYLPTLDLASVPLLFIWRSDLAIIGMGGIEPNGAVGLLRSVVIAKRYQHQGHGQACCQGLIEQAKQQGIAELYLLTVSAQPFFQRLGFEPIGREAAPPAIQATAQFSQLCPDSAICMKLDL